MTLKDWIYGTGFDNPKVNGEWGPLHIATLIICIALIISISIIFKNKDEKTKDIFIYSIGAFNIILFIVYKIFF